MKKRNLFLSLVCSIILTVALVAVTLASVLVPSNRPDNSGNHDSNVSDRPGIEEPINPNYPSNDDNDGSEEKPYIIYNAESFMDLLKKYGDQEKYFELDRDIDFAGTEYVTLFQETAFNGHINGKGFALKNISINVKSENLNNFIVKDVDGKFVSNVAVFGKVNGAEIADLVYDNLQISVADEVYDYIRGGAFVADNEAAFKQLTIGTVAAIAENSTIEAKVVATINADAYSVYAENYVQGYNALGGMIGVANGVTINNSNVDVKIVANSGEHYFVGGVAAYAYNTTIANTNVSANIVAEYDQTLYIGGVAGYVIGAKIENVEVSLVANQAGDRFNTAGVEKINDSKFNSVAGIVNLIRANDNTQLTSINNVVVTANVDMDCIYAGAVVEVLNADLVKGEITSERYVTIKDVVIDSNVNVLKAFGFSKKLVATTVELTKAAVDIENECSYNVKLTGKVLLNANSDDLLAALFVNDIVEMSTNTNYFDVVGDYSTVKVVVSSQILSRVGGEADRNYTTTIVD